ncbi:hypothetical protein LY76DRAFT_582364 [Colletotrichum caudatum]|nr:hypothetical protein LY76DRAFT_582364 [Colletotrichum caudatum]
MGERTGSRVFQWVWSYVPGSPVEDAYNRTTMRYDGLQAKVRRASNLYRNELLAWLE